MSMMVRRKSNRIDCLKLDNGDWIYSRIQTGNLFAARFVSIYDTPNFYVICDLSELVNPVISEEENYELMSIPSWDVVFTMGAFKASGLDGIPVLFYKFTRTLLAMI